LADLEKFNQLKESIENIGITNDLSQKATSDYEQRINANRLFFTQSSILVSMFKALKSHQKLTNELSYSWSRYLKIIDSIIKKLIRDKTSKKKHHDSDTEEAKELIIDSDFFRHSLIPSVYMIVVSGIHHSNISLYNLILSLQLGRDNG